MDMTMSSIRPAREEVVTSVQRRRRWTPEQKLEIVKQTNGKQTLHYYVQLTCFILIVIL
jgi:transposase-like protein